MPDPIPSRRLRRRLAPLFIALGVLAIVVLALPTVRHRLLRSAGWALAAQEIATSGDVIVVSTDADGAGVLEATDLIRAGVASRVAVFPDPPEAVDREFVRRGVAYYNAAAVTTMQLKSLGINTVEMIPWAVTGTEDEGRVLGLWAAQTGIHTIIFVSTADHSRRTRRVLNRAMRGSGVRLVIRYSRYSTFDPDAWWLTRGGIRTEIVESQKLLLDVILHPFS